MNVKHKVAFYMIGTLLVLLVASNVYAQGNDVNKSKDHPMISRFPGSSIARYDQKGFDEYILPLGKADKGKLTKSQKLEGKVTQITYSAPVERSILEIYRNYESGLKKAGFEVLFSAKKEALGEKWFDSFIGAVSRTVPYGGVGLGVHLGDNFRYLVAKSVRPEGNVYASLCVGGSWFQKNPMIQLDVIEVKPMDTGLIKVNAEKLGKDITEKGRVSIYGIYFDTGKAAVKSESGAALKEIAKLLQQNPDLKVYIVGHTDKVGSIVSNMTLSLRRAEAVVKMLVSQNGIDAKRLAAYGVGPLSPVASNRTEAGRVKNRRVELVEQ